jgi:hypothetical protein
MGKVVDGDGPELEAESEAGSRFRTKVQFIAALSYGMHINKPMTYQNKNRKNKN